MEIGIYILVAFLVSQVRNKMLLKIYRSFPTTMSYFNDLSNVLLLMIIGTVCARVEDLRMTGQS